MALNIITDKEIKDLSKVLLDIVDAQEEDTIQDMKDYLSTTQLSEDEKLTRFAEFRQSIFATKLQSTFATAQQYILSDKQLYQAKLLNDSQIELNQKQLEVANKDIEVKEQQRILTSKQVLKAEEEIATEKEKQYLAIAETKSKLDLSTAQTLSEARRNGSPVVKTERTWTCPATNQTITYDHLSLTPIDANSVAGEIGARMSLWEKQSKSFADHSKVQVANQINQLTGIAVDSGAGNITGLLNSAKLLQENIVGFPLDASYSTVTAG